MVAVPQAPVPGSGVRIDTFKLTSAFRPDFHFRRGFHGTGITGIACACDKGRTLQIARYIVLCIMPIDVLPGAEEDIEQLASADPAALAAVLAFIEEAESDTALEATLTTVGNVNCGSFRVNIKRWVLAQSSGNLLRLRILDTPATGYRVIYGFDWRKRRIGILAIVDKSEFDYEISSKLAFRILRDWNMATDGRPT